MSQEIDIRACRMLLHEIGEMCDHASLTGSLEGGAGRTAQRFNSVLEKLVNGGVVPKDLFSPLKEGSNYGEIGAEARMLASYCRNDEKHKRREESDSERSILMRLAPFVRQEELGMLIREHRTQGMKLDMDVLANLAPFLGQDVLSDLLKEQLSKASTRSEPLAPPKREEPAKPQSTPAPTPWNFTLTSVSDDPTPQKVEPSEPEPAETEPKESITDLLTLLKSPYLSEDDRLAIIEKIERASR